MLIAQCSTISGRDDNYACQQFYFDDYVGCPSHCNMTPLAEVSWRAYASVVAMLGALRRRESAVGDSADGESTPQAVNLLEMDTKRTPIQRHGEGSVGAG